MADLGWTPIRLRDLMPGGYNEQVRGYCRLSDRLPPKPTGASGIIAAKLMEQLGSAEQLKEPSGQVRRPPCAQKDGFVSE